MLFKKVNVVKPSNVITGSLAEAKKQVKREGYYTMPHDGCLSVNQYYSILKRMKNNLKVEFSNKELENQFYGFNTLNQALKNAGYKGYTIKILKNTQKYVDFIFKFSKLNDKNQYDSCICNARYSVDSDGTEKIEEIKK